MTRRRKKRPAWSDTEEERQALIVDRVESWDNASLYGEPDEPHLNEIVDRIFADCLGFLFTHCFSPQSCSLRIAQRRFLALVYIYRPDLIESRSVADIAKEVEFAKGTIGQSLTDLRRELGATGINSMDADARRRVREGQIKARLIRARKRKAKRAAMEIKRRKRK